MEAVARDKITVGEFVALYLQHLGIDEYFTVPGDFNLLLLDEMLKNKKLKLINCCNELNAGYAADGYARKRGIGAAVITYSVGGLSAVNAIAGAYSENIPVILISGGPNSNSLYKGEILHHTLGELRYDYVKRIYAEITALSVVIQHPSEIAPGLHKAFQTAVSSNKPVYVEIACNIVQEKIYVPHLPSVLSLILNATSDPTNLQAAVSHAAKILNQSRGPVIVVGSKGRVLRRKQHGADAVLEFVDKTKYAVAVLPDAKGAVADTHPSHIGTYWGDVSLPTHATAEVVEGSDTYIFIGPAFTDYTTCGNTIQLDRKKLIMVDLHEVQIQGQTYYNVEMLDFLKFVQDELTPNSGSVDSYHKLVPQNQSHVINFKKNANPNPTDAVTSQQMVKRIQELILDAPNGHKYTLIAETGDAWFSALKLQLPFNHSHEVQMAYGSIGWSVGATLGYAMAAAKENRRVISLIGDGSFQLTAQEVATMIRYQVNPIIFLINNYGYTIEEEIHKGPYNQIKNWDYAGLIDVFNANERSATSYGKGVGIRVSTNLELDGAIRQALEYKQGPTLIEVQVDPSDCNIELTNWGKAVSAFNSRKALVKSSQITQDDD